MALILLLLSALLALLVWLMLTSPFNAVLVLEMEFNKLSGASGSFPMVLDTISIIFLMTVMIISCSVLSFSMSYMSGDPNYLRFHLLVISFIASMALLIVSPNLISLLLGWDGLGLSSYLLVAFFQNSKSFNAAKLTVLSNRVGDLLILSSIALASTSGLWAFSSFSSLKGVSGFSMVIILMSLASFTKSAQVPFSAWLPAAMAAPTPVSSLVHSSTLVTAGVYLIIRLGLNMTSTMLLVILFIGLATMTMAGISAMMEKDMKKIVALSTLSQLGLMMATLGMGEWKLSFLHLVSHAFFKALLFISVGSMIHLSDGLQDVRKIGLTPFSALSISFSMAANMSLCGLPFTSGFISKDLIIETSTVKSLSAFVEASVFMGVILTIGYSARFCFLTWGEFSRSSPMLNEQDNCSFTHTGCLSLFPLALSGASLVASLLFCSLPYPVIPSVTKSITSLCLAVGVTSGVYFFLTQPRVPLSALFSWGSMWALPLISSKSLSTTSLFLAGKFRNQDLKSLNLLSTSALSGGQSLLALDHLFKPNLPMNLLTFMFTLLLIWWFLY